MKKFKAWLKDWWLFIIWWVADFTLLILDLTLKLPEWGFWIINAGLLLVILSCPLVWYWIEKRRARKRGEK